MTSVPAPRTRIAFPQIAAVSWEHPADRAALQSLRAVPGFDDVVRKIVSILGGERGIRLLFQGNSVRTAPNQFPKAYGVDDPFIVVHSAALELLDDDELRVLLAHEMGHVVSGHALYRTIAEILLNVSLGALPF